MSTVEVPTSNRQARRSDLREALAVLEPECSYATMSYDEISWEILDTEVCLNPAKWIASVICKHGHTTLDEICGDHLDSLTHHSARWLCGPCGVTGALADFSVEAL